MSDDDHKKRVTYEWTFEVLDEYGDIIDSYFFDSLDAVTLGLAKLALTHPKTNHFGLVRYYGSRAEGADDTLWAYWKDGELAPFFNAGGDEFTTDMPVPKKFREELKRYMAKQ